MLYVDIGNNRNVLENLSLSFVSMNFALWPLLHPLNFAPQMYESIVEDPYKDTGTADTIAFTGEENVHFPAMREWILQHLKGVADRGYVGVCVGGVAARGYVCV